MQGSRKEQIKKEEINQLNIEEQAYDNQSIVQKEIISQSIPNEPGKKQKIQQKMKQENNLEDGMDNQMINIQEDNVIRSLKRYLNQDEKYKQPEDKIVKKQKNTKENI